MLRLLYNGCDTKHTFAGEGGGGYNLFSVNLFFYFCWWFDKSWKNTFTNISTKLFICILQCPAGLKRVLYVVWFVWRNLSKHFSFFFPEKYSHDWGKMSRLLICIQLEDLQLNGSWLSWRSCLLWPTSGFIKGRKNQIKIKKLIFFSFSYPAPF